MNTKELAQEIVKSLANYPGVTDSECVKETLDKEFNGTEVPTGLTDRCFRSACLATFHQINKQVIPSSESLPHHMYNTIYTVMRMHINVA